MQLILNYFIWDDPKWVYISHNVMLTSRTFLTTSAHKHRAIIVSRIRSISERYTFQNQSIFFRTLRFSFDNWVLTIYPVFSDNPNLCHFDKLIVISALLRIINSLRLLHSTVTLTLNKIIFRCAFLLHPAEIIRCEIMMKIETT